jgi:hypothetical protein
MRPFICACLLCLVTTQLSHTQTLRVFMGTDLLYLSSSGIVKVWGLKHDDYFQGYDLVDSDHVFFAYCFADGGEPSTALRLFDLRTGKVQVLGQLDDTGDCWYTYSRENGLILLTWIDGIYTWDCVRKKGTEPKLVIRLPMGCVFPYWVDASTIGYTRCGVTDQRPAIVPLTK